MKILKKILSLGTFIILDGRIGKISFAGELPGWSWPDGREKGLKGHFYGITDPLTKEFIRFVSMDETIEVIKNA